MAPLIQNEVTNDLLHTLAALSLSNKYLLAIGLEAGLVSAELGAAERNFWLLLAIEPRFLGRPDYNLSD
jgi:hypothetical protein